MIFRYCHYVKTCLSILCHCEDKLNCWFYRWLSNSYLIWDVYKYQIFLSILQFYACSVFRFWVLLLQQLTWVWSLFLFVIFFLWDFWCDFSGLSLLRGMKMDKKSMFYVCSLHCFLCFSEHSQQVLLESQESLYHSVRLDWGYLLLRDVVINRKGLS